MSSQVISVPWDLHVESHGREVVGISMSSQVISVPSRRRIFSHKSTAAEFANESHLNAIFGIVQYIVCKTYVDVFHRFYAASSI